MATISKSLGRFEYPEFWSMHKFLAPEAANRMFQLPEFE